MININLIAERRARKLHEMALMRWSACGLGVLILVMAGLNLMAWFELRAHQEQHRVAQVELDKLRGQRMLLQQTVLSLNEKGPLVELLAQVRLSEGAWMTILADISYAIPHQVFLTNVTANSSREGLRLRFDGQALDEKAVANFMQALNQQTAWVDQPATLTSVNMERNTGGEDKRVRFDFNVAVRGLLGGDLK